MSSNRVDQIAVAAALRDHNARIRALEATPSVGGGGIQYDTDNVGDWLNIEATSADPSTGLAFKLATSGGQRYEDDTGISVATSGAYSLEVSGSGNDGYQAVINDSGIYKVTAAGGSQFFGGSSTLGPALSAQQNGDRANALGLTTRPSSTHDSDALNIDAQSTSSHTGTLVGISQSISATGSTSGASAIGIRSQVSSKLDAIGAYFSPTAIGSGATAIGIRVDPIVQTGATEKTGLWANLTNGTNPGSPQAYTAVLADTPVAWNGASFYSTRSGILGQLYLKDTGGGTYALIARIGTTETTVATG